MKFGNWAKETSLTTGGGALALVQILNTPRISDEFDIGVVVNYAIENGVNKEVGQGVVGAGNTLTRVTIEATYIGTTYNDVNPTALTLVGGSTVYATASNKTMNALFINTAKMSGSTFETIQDMFNVFYSSGVIDGHLINDNLDGSITVPLGKGLIRANDSETAQVIFFDWVETVVALTDNSLNYIYVQYNSGVPNIVKDVTKRTDLNTNILLGTVYRIGSVLHISKENGFNISDSTSKMILRNQEINPFARVSGGIVSEIGTRNLALTAGIWWQGLERYATDVKDTSVADSFVVYYQDGVGSWTSVTLQTQIDNLNYDDGSGTLAVLGNAKYGVHWVFLGADSDFYIVYGVGSYSLAEAENANIPSNTPPHFESHARLIGKVTIQKSATSMQVENAFETIFETYAASSHSELTGLTNDDHTQYLLADGTRAATKFEFTGEIFKTGATLNGTAITNHVNLGGGASITGTAVQAYDFCTVGGGEDCEATNAHATSIGGYNVIATGQYSSGLGGRDNNIIGRDSSGTGRNNTVAGIGAFAAGNAGSLSGNYSFGFGDTVSTDAGGSYSGAIGRGSAASHSHCFVAGGGGASRANFDFIWSSVNSTVSSVANNVARLTSAGDFKIDGTVSSPEADIAECVEWADGNTSNEDRNGLLVSVFQGKLILGDSNPYGIISAAPSLISNAAPNGWSGTYLKDKHKRNLKTKYTKIDWVDDWGDEQYVYESQDKTLYDEYPQPTAVNGIISSKIPIGNLKKETIFTNTINPLFDITLVENYKPRNERKEWGVVGVLGQIPANTSENITGWKVDADPNNLGSFINGTTYDVIEHIDNETALVFYK